MGVVEVCTEWEYIYGNPILIWESHGHGDSSMAPYWDGNGDENYLAGTGNGTFDAWE